MDNKQTITIKTIVNAPVETVWNYWTEPEHIKKWNNASENWHTTAAENDLRVGGRFLSRMEAKDGSFGFDFSGTYDEVKLFESISYTLGDERKVKITFISKEKKTEIMETFEAENTNSIEMQESGWQAILDNFKRYTEETTMSKVELLNVLKDRFEKNLNRHNGLEWAKVQAKLEANADKLWSLNEMEKTGGEPDVVAYDETTGEYIFYDCSAESPKGRRSVCYDREALESRKEHKPENSATDMAAAMGIELLTEAQYRELQKLENFDMKTSSWLKTPSEIRKLGGAIFADFRYGNVFVYHNGAESYYGARGFRGSLRV